MRDSEASSHLPFELSPPGSLPKQEGKTEKSELGWRRVQLQSQLLKSQEGPKKRCLWQEKKKTPKEKAQLVSRHSCLPSGAPAEVVDVRMRILPGTAMCHLGQGHRPEFAEVQEEMEAHVWGVECTASQPSPPPTGAPLPHSSISLETAAAGAGLVYAAGAADE